MFEIEVDVPEPIVDEIKEGLVGAENEQAFIGSQIPQRRSSAVYRKGTGDSSKRHLWGKILKTRIE